ncbi:MAG: protein kinase, partial [Deltaproteobacteria bacterium]|nr:protein kinase [Deltaproteobacteria bacterium]
FTKVRFPGTEPPPSKKPELAITADALNSTRNPASNHPKRPLPAAVTVGYDEGAEEAIPPTEYAPHSPRVSSDSLLPLRKGMVLVDRYEVADHLGSGGFGDIYLARDIKEGMGEREVVIKIPRASSYREDTPQRLKREWLLTGQMPDQHTVIMYDLLHLNVERRALDGKKTSTAIWVPVMEHVPGYDFIKYRRALRNHDKEFLSKNGLSSVEDRVRLFEAACEALAAVHRLGIVHHDLKLENIREYLPDGVLTTPSKRQVRIMDFGQAKLIDEPEDRNSSSPPPPAASDRRSSKDFKQARELNFLTSPELLSGTPGYIPPERFPPNVYKPDLRADIFQMGIILYELISGTHPAAFYMDNPNPHGPRKISKKTDKGETIILPQSTTIMGAHPPPHLREVMVETSPYLDRLDQIFRKATAQKPEDRYQSIDDMRSDLALLPADLMTDQLKTLEEFQQKNIQLLHQNFTAGNEGLQESLESLSELNREIPLLRERLVGQLTGLAEQGNLLARARIVESSWKQLTAEDSHLPHSIQTILLDRIRRYAPEQKEKLDAGVALHFSGTDLLQRQPLKDFQVRVLRYQEKRPGVFREGDVLVPSISVSILQHSLRLPVGDYVFEVYHPDYHYFRTAQRVSYAHLQTSVQQEAPLNLHFDFARKQALPSGFAWVSGGESSFGVPLLKVQNPTVLGLMPETKRRLPAFGMSAPVSEADYAGFLSSQLEWVHYYLRRGDLTQAPQMMNRVLSLLPSHWKLTSQGENLATYYSISDFENLTRSSRPVHSLSSQAAQEYAQWKSQQEGHRYQVATPFHLEKVTRNGLAWESAQGKPFRSSDLAQGHDSSVYAFLNKQGQVERLKISSDIYHLESHGGQKGAFRLVIEF